MRSLLTLLIVTISTHGANAKDILNDAGVKGGIVIHIGCDKPERLIELYLSGSYIVQALDPDSAKVDKAREVIQSKGLYGKISVSTFDGKHLPYADNLINLVVIPYGTCQVSNDEVQRVLVPGGVAMIHGKVIEKTRPEDIDEWTHHLYDAGSNPVAKDRVVGPPRHMQWTAGPLWARSHAWSPSVSAMVSSGGRIFFILDETLTGVDKSVPDKWFVVARDAFNGTLLWKQPIPQWGTKYLNGLEGTGFPVSNWTFAKRRVKGTFEVDWRRSRRLTSKCGPSRMACKLFLHTGLRHLHCHECHYSLREERHSYALDSPFCKSPVSNGRFSMSANIAKRLVAIGDTVYVTLGATAPVSALDAATGEIKATYKDTVYADEFVSTDGRLIVTINQPNLPKDIIPEENATPPPPPRKHICAVDTKTGKTLWKQGPFVGVRTARGQDPFGRLELAAGDGKVFILTQKTIVCMEIDSGTIAWTIDRPALPEGTVTKLGFSGMYEYLLTVMMYNDGVVLLAQPEPDWGHTWHTMPGTLFAFDAKNGKRIWDRPYGAWGHCTQPDLFVVNGAVWNHVHADAEYTGRTGGGGRGIENQEKVAYRIQSLDLKTGKVLSEMSTKDIFNIGHHHRCYRNKITERFFTSSRRGVEFVNLETGEYQQHHWVRSGCQIGNMPCNGLLYVTPHPCGCYRTSLLTGFNALAPASGPIQESGHEIKESERLMKGPAYGTLFAELQSPAPESWPTYRGNTRRSGDSTTTVPPKLNQSWKTDLGSKVGPLTISDENSS